ncbi:MAG: pentapeptide repeat-containing protein [Spirulinaceae cyanobacterium]
MNVKELVNQYAAGVRDFRGVNLNEANLRGINLSGADLSGASLNVANLSGANLSGANLSRAKLNVARLSAANLSRANLTGAFLNVANLIRADLAEAELREAVIVRAELVRAELSSANLSGANLNGTDLREATLRNVNLSYSNLSEVNLRDAVMTGAILEQSILNGSDLSRTDMRDVNLRDAELSQANLNRSNLSGADVRRSNLRWVDLSGANLSWADLSDAKLSGANLIGSDLSHANLVNTSLVHADLTQARLIEAEWVGADLTGATLTGAKLYGVPRFGLKTEGVACHWVDLSPGGDRSQIYRLTPEKAKRFFNQTLPTVQVIIDAPYTLPANLALAAYYERIGEVYPPLKQPPSVEVSSRRTYLTFKTDTNQHIFALAYCAVLPFRDSSATEHYLMAVLEQLQAAQFDTIGVREHSQIRSILANLKSVYEQIKIVRKEAAAFQTEAAKPFLQAPTHTILTNSSNKTLDIYLHPAFGRRGRKISALTTYDGVDFHLNVKPELILPPVKTVLQFIQDFFDEIKQVV